MLVEGLQTVLAADATMQTQLGTPANRSDKSTGIFPVQAPDEVPAPWLVYQQISGNPLQESMQGTGRLTTSRWRFTCYGSTYKQAKVLAKTLRLVILALDGAMAGAQSHTEVHGAWHRLELDDAEPMPRGTIYATHLDFEIVYLDTE